MQDEPPGNTPDPPPAGPAPDGSGTTSDTPATSPATTGPAPKPGRRGPKSVLPSPRLRRLHSLLALTFAALWLAPILYVGLFRRSVPNVGLYLNDLYRVACLFTYGMKSWSNYYYLVKLDGQPGWHEAPEPDYSSLQPFGHRSRLHRMISDVGTDAKAGRIFLADLARFFKKRHAEINPDAPEVVAFRIVAIEYPVGDPDIASPPGHWRRPPLTSFPRDRWRTVYTHPF